MSESKPSERKPTGRPRSYMAYIVYDDQSIGLRTDGSIELNGKPCDNLDEIGAHIRKIAVLQDKALQV